MVRIFGYYVSRGNLFLGLADFLLIWGSYLVGILVRFGFGLPKDLFYSDVVSTGMVVAVVMSLSIMSMGLYRRSAHNRDEGFFVRLAIAFLIGTSAVALIIFLFPSVVVGRGVLALSILIAFCALVLLRSFVGRLTTNSSNRRRLLVVGTGVEAQYVAELAQGNPNVGYVIVGYLPLASGQHSVREERLLSRGGSLLDLAVANNVDEIVIAADNRYADLPIGELLDCKLSGFAVFDLVTFFERELAMIKIDFLHPAWLFLSQDGFRTGMSGLYGKRLFDLLISVLMLVATAPIMVLIGFASLIESKGRDPVLYHQVRIGEGGTRFRIHKFRTMRADAEADGKPRWACIDDERVTRLGRLLRKTRLDEVPQLFNVVKGQMSLVGPRPERPEFVERLASTIPCYAQRHRVKPGITGWAQLLYPYGSSEEDAKRKLEYDLYYVKHASMMFDFVILVQTVEIVLLGRGAR